MKEIDYEDGEKYAFIGYPVRFDGSDSDVTADGETIVNYMWDFDDGQGFVERGPIETFTFNSTTAPASPYEVALEVTDSAGRVSVEDSCICEVTVVNPNDTANCTRYYVNSTAGDDGWDGSYGNPKETIQAAINAITGDIAAIQVAAGTYPETLDFGTKIIYLTSENTNDPASTIIDGGSAAYPVIELDPNDDCSVIIGFTITGGGDGGIQGNGACGHVEKCIITGNSKSGPGGGIQSVNGVITNCTITGNSGYSGGLGGCMGVIRNCLIAENSGTMVGAIKNCDGEIINCTIAGNSTDDPEDPDAYVISQSEAEITNCIIWDNDPCAIEEDSYFLGYGCVENLASYEADPPTPDFYWHLDETSGHIAEHGDDYGSIDGTLYDGTAYGESWDTGQVNNAVSLDGMDDYIDLGDPNSLELIFPVTISAWIKPEAIESQMNILTLGGQDSYSKGIWFRVRPDGTLVLAYGSGSTSYRKDGNVTLSATNWYHVTGIIHNAYHIDLYVNGQLDDGGTYVGTPGSVVYNSTNRIGANNATPPSSTFNGLIDEVAIYGEVLSKAEINRQYWNGCGSNDSHYLITGNISSDPCFAVSAPDGDYHLKNTSPCVNAGDTTASSGLDIDLEERVILDQVDIGCDEFAYVNNNGSYYMTIQGAISAAGSGDTVIVSPGTYEEFINFGGKSITVTSMDPSTPEIVEATIIQGGYPTTQGPVVTFSNGEDSSSILRGFTITLGKGCWGGGIYCNNSSPKIEYCVIGNNYSSDKGAGIFCKCSNPDISNCTFIENIPFPMSSILGGGIYNANSSPMIRNCQFIGNEADWGGAIYNCYNEESVCSSQESDPLIFNCFFAGNIASNLGGGVYSSGGSGHICDPNMVNCIFSGNSAANDGGGVYSGIHANSALNNCTFSNNSAGGNGGGIYNASNSTAAVSNSILWGNSDQGGAGVGESAQIYNSGGTRDVNYSCVKEWTSGGTDNISDDPCFIDPDGGDDTYGTLDDDVRIPYRTNFIDAGRDSAIPETIREEPDIAGNDRFVDIPHITNNAIWGIDNVVDMGAYEHVNVAPIIFVDSSVTSGENNGIGWENALLSLDDALDIANVVGADVWVAHGVGTYKSDDWDGFEITGAISVYGGFAGNEDPQTFDLADRDFDTYETILDGDNDEDYVANITNSSVVLDGFTIKNAYETGIYCDNSSPTIRCCKIIDNGTESSYYSYGGIKIDSSESPEIINCLISDNEKYGIHGGTPQITNCTIANHPYYGIRASGSTAKNCILWQNNLSYSTRDDYYGSLTISYSCIEQGALGENCTNIDPDFVDDDNANPALRDYHLQPWSLCIDAGDHNSDCSKEPIPNGSRINMGAYGNTLEATTNPDSEPDGIPDNWELHYWRGDDPSIHLPEHDLDDDGLSNWDEYNLGWNPTHNDSASIIGIVSNIDRGIKFPSITMAIDFSVDGETLMLVNESTYIENIDLNGKTLTLKSSDPSDPEVVAGTIIQATGTTMKAVQVRGASAVTLDGLTIQGGQYGVYCEASSSTTTINRCILTNNSYGFDASDHPVNVSSTKFLNNTACGMRLRNDAGNSNSTISGCTFSGNGSSGCYLEFRSGCKGELVNCIISKNGSHGLHFNGSGQEVDIENCTIVDNGGYGIYGISSHVLNCILWNNNNGDFYSSYLPGSCDYTCLGSLDSFSSGTGNLSANPIFMNAPGGDYHLQEVSRCIDAGDPVSIYSQEPSPNGSRINMGAYGNTDEATVSPVSNDGDNISDAWELRYWPSDDPSIHLPTDDPDSDGLNNWDEYNIGWDPTHNDSASITGIIRNEDSGIKFPSLAMAIDFLTDGEILTLVDASTYIQDIDFNNKTLTLRSSDPSNPTTVASTIIQATATDQKAVWVRGGSVVTLDGVTIQSGEYGVYCEDSSTELTVSRCVIKENDYGLYLNNVGGSAEVENCTISDNETGVYCNNDNVTISHCLIESNTNRGINCNSTDPAIENCVIYNNQAGTATNGGGVYNGGGSPSLINCLILNNSATNGGGLYTNSGVPVLVNCTLYGNTATTSGGGVYINSDNPVIANCILWDNSDTDGTDESAQIHVVSGTPDIDYGCVQGWEGTFSGTSIYGFDPQFFDDSSPEGDDGVFMTSDDGLRIRSSSMYIDAGDNTAISVTTDIVGNYRKLDVPTIPDTGSGTVPIVDLGAYEHVFNESPETQDITLYVAKNSSVDFTLIASDPESDPLTYDYEEPQNGQITGTAPQLTYTPDTDYTGMDGFSYNVYDGQNYSFSRVYIEVLDAGTSDIPVAYDQTVLTNENESIDIYLIAVDSSDSATSLTYNITSGPSDGTLTFVSDNCYEYSPDSYFNGTDSFTFTATDSQSNESNTATVTVEVIKAADIWHVNNAVSGGTGDGTSWENAFSTLQAAFDETGLEPGDEIWVAQGNAPYYPSTRTDPSDPYSVTFVLPEGVTILGGFAGDEQYREERDYTTNITILSGDIGTADYTGDNSYHVVTGSDDAILDGFMIASGNAHGTGSDANGGGIYNYQAAPKIKNSILIANLAGGNGAAIYNDDCTQSPVITNCDITANTATGSGGGIYNLDSKFIGINSIIWGNSDSVVNSSSTAVFSYCDIQGCGGSGGSWVSAIGTDGGNNIDGDPCFVDADGTDDTLGTDDDDLSLGSGSPCIGTGIDGEDIGLNWPRQSTLIGSAVSIANPVDIEVDSDTGDVYVLSSSESKVYIYDDQLQNPSTITVSATNPMGLALDGNDKMYIADTDGDRILKYTISTGQLDTSFDTDGIVGQSGQQKGNFNQPWGISVGGDDRVYVSDSGNNRVQIFDASNGQFVGLWGVPGSGDGQISSPTGFHLKSSAMSGELFLADSGNDRIQRLSSGSGRYLSQAGTSGSDPGQFDYPSNVCYDRQFDQIIVTDTGNNRIQLFQISSYGDFSAADMVYTDQITEVTGATPSTLYFPMAVASACTDTAQILYVADTGNGRILKIERPRFKSGQSPLHTWESFKTALRSDDLDEALSFIAPFVEEKYTTVLTDLEPVFSTLVNGMGSMTLYSLESSIARYEMLHDEGGGILSKFPVFFCKDGTGEWKIYGF